MTQRIFILGASIALALTLAACDAGDDQTPRTRDRLPADSAPGSVSDRDLSTPSDILPERNLNTPDPDEGFAGENVDPGEQPGRREE